MSVRLISYLYDHWDQEVDLYSINIPLLDNVDSKPLFWSKVFPNFWSSGSCLDEVDTKGDGAHDNGRQQRKFKWAPKLDTLTKAIEDSGPGNDAWIVKEGYTRYFYKMLCTALC